MSDWLEVIARDELEESKITPVDFGGKEVAVVLLEGQLYAIDELCPHQGAPLATQGILNAPKKEIACSWHGWRFDLESGKSTNVPGYRTDTYEVKEEDGKIFLKEKERLSSSSASGKPEASNAEDQKLLDQVLQIVESDIRPAVQMDGGDIEIVGLDEGVVKVKLHGACTSCSASSVTLYQGVQNILSNRLPDIRGIEQVF
jgi:nitrite reductase/ring-hydroxylating ferredoxin subunit/Fe-S cluster biogenesis protein NfuA